MLGDLLAGKPLNQHDALGIAQDAFAEWAGMAGQYRPPINAHGQTAHGSQSPFPPNPFRPHPADHPPWRPNSPPPPPPVDHQEEARLEAIRQARQALGFAAKEPLTEEVVKDRRKQLARKHHPDRGGSVQRMMTINNAADVLLASLPE